jgi:hypothetical protein
MDKTTAGHEIERLTAVVEQLRDREIAAEIAALRAEVAALRAEHRACHYQSTYTWTYPGVTWSLPNVTINGNTA